MNRPKISPHHPTPMLIGILHIAQKFFLCLLLSRTNHHNDAIPSTANTAVIFLLCVFFHRFIGEFYNVTEKILIFHFLSVYL